MRFKKFLAAVSAISILSANTSIVMADDSLTNSVTNNSESSEYQGYVPNEIIVKTNGIYSTDEINDLFSNNKVRRSASKFSGSSNEISLSEVKDLTKTQNKNNTKMRAKAQDKDKIFLLKLSDLDQDIYDTIDKLKEYPEIEFASPNYEFKMSDESTPKFDDYFDDEYPKGMVMWGLEYVNGPEAWEYNSGSPDVVVGIVDSGVDFNHPDLKDNMWINKGEWGENGELSNNGIDDDGNGYVDDYNGWNFYYDNNETFDVDGHGSHVAGTAAASGKNNKGMYGVAKNCSIASLRISSNVDSEHRYSEYSFASVIEALDYANKMNIPVTNNSYSQACNGIPNRDEDFSKIFEAAIGNYNGIYVASAGNDGEGFDANYPAAYDCDNIISVSGSNKFGDPEYDNFNFDSDTVDLAAPGVNIWSCNYNTKGYVSFSGTSMAVPHVVGTVALLKSFKPEMSLAEIKDCILSTVKKTDGFAAGIFVGTDGILDAEAAMAKAEEMYPSPVTSVGTKKSWNFSSSAFRNLGNINANTEIRDLSLIPDGSMEIKTGTTKINNRDEYTHYLSLGGDLEFDVNGDTDIYITAKSASGSQSINLIDENDEVVSGGALTFTTNPEVKCVQYKGEPQRIRLSGSNINLVKIVLRSGYYTLDNYENKNWNFSDDIFNGLGEVLSKKNINDMVLYPDIEFVDKTETIDNTTYTRYLDLKGKGSKENREISVYANGNSKITITAKGSDEERTLQIIDSFGCIVGEMNVGNVGKTETFEYIGNPVDLSISSSKGGIKLYNVAVEQIA